MNKQISIILFLLICFFSGFAQQNVGINTTPDSSAALHVEATDKGMLIPRMTSSQRTAISNVANGLLVYDITTNSFWFYQNNDWQELVGGDVKSDGLSDSDGDTRIQLEENSNDNTIRFDAQGVESMVLTPAGELQIKGADSNDAGFLELFNGDTTQFLRFFGGRLGDPEPFLGWRTGFPFRFITSNPDYSGFTEYMRIAGDGKVGIGNENPEEALDVAGNVKADTLLGDGSKLTGLPDTTTTYSVGDFSQGGIVFWVDGSGEHGLVCAKQDQSTGVRWYAGTFGTTRAKGDGPYSGEMNTAIIIASQVAIGDDGNPYAAQICADLEITEGGYTYGDWYLPSKEELNLMYQNRTVINATAIANGGSAFASGLYWSSTENSSGNAELQSLTSSSQDDDGKEFSRRVRAIRAF